MDSKDKLDLYDCATLFLESMHERCPYGCPDDSAIFLVVTNGKNISAIIDGDDGLLRSLIANAAVHDKKVRDLIGDGLIAAIQHEQEESQDSYNQRD